MAVADGFMREQLDMSLCCATVIDNSAPEEGDEIGRTPCSHHLPAKGRVAIIGTIGLRPANERFYNGTVEICRDHSWMVGYIEFDAVAVREIVSLTVVSIIDRIAFEAIIEEPSDASGKPSAP